MPIKDPEKRRAYHRDYFRKWRKRNPEKSRAYNRQWKKSDIGKEWLKRFNAKAENKKYHRDWMRNNYHLNPEARARRQAAAQEWAKRNSQNVKSYMRRWKLLKKYGITPEEYDAMLESQGGKCALCQATPTARKRLAIDHDHTTGQIRGILCGPCNIALGFIESRQKSLLPLYFYISRNAYPKKTVAVA